MMEATDTKTKLLDVAERLFAEKGIHAISLRNIISEAEVNLAAIHYHFGSKEALLREVFSRRIKPVNEERLRRLDELLAVSGNAKTDLAALVRAFLEPVVRIRFESPNRTLIIMKLVHQLQADSGDLREVFYDLVEGVISRFMDAFGEALPHLSTGELFWRFKFMLGVLHMIMAQPPICKPGFDFDSVELDLENVTNKVVPFLVAGFEAPATEARNMDNGI